jgi:hypothetical protein
MSHNRPVFNKRKGIAMIINWVTTKARQFLPGQDAGLDELNVSFDFALSPEIMDLLYAQNDDCMDAAVAEAGQPAEDAAAITQFELDEHELALT